MLSQAEEKELDSGLENLEAEARSRMGGMAKDYLTDANSIKDFLTGSLSTTIQRIELKNRDAHDWRDFLLKVIGAVVFLITGLACLLANPGDKEVTHTLLNVLVGVLGGLGGYAAAKQQPKK